jgi:hypothetical protein
MLRRGLATNLGSASAADLDAEVEEGQKRGRAVWRFCESSAQEAHGVTSASEVLRFIDTGVVCMET